MKLFYGHFSDLRSELKGLGFLFIALAALEIILLFPYANIYAKACFATIGGVGAIAFLKQGESSRKPYPSSIPSLLLFFSTALFLAILTYVAFYKPMLEHYWIGLDEPVLLGIQSPWFDVYDKCCSRPLAGLLAFIGNLVTPGETSGLLIINALGRWIIAVGVFSLVILLLPEAKSLAIAAGILMVINPTEVLRFSPGLSTPYVGVMTFFILSSCIFVLSYITASRVLLLMACAFLGVAFLHYETIFPVSVLIPLLILFIPAKNQRFLWMGAWYLTTLAFAIRLTSFLLQGSSYQFSYIRDLSLATFAENFTIILKPIIVYIQTINFTNLASFEFLPLGLGIATFIFLALMEYRFPRDAKIASVSGLDGQKLRRQLWLILAAFVALALAILPQTLVPASQINIPDFRDNPTMRLEFTPGPWQAVLLASLIGLASSLLFWPRFWFSIGIATIVTFSVSGSLELQAEKGKLNSYLDFQKESNILRAAAPLVRQLPTDAVVFFIIPDDEPSPFGWGYHIFHMSCLLFGRPGYAGHYSPELGIQHRTFPYPTPINLENHYVPLIGVNNLSFVRVERSQDLSDFQVRLEKQNSDKPPTTAYIGPLGPCSVPMARMLPGGDLPFILPKY